MNGFDVKTMSKLADELDALLQKICDAYCASDDEFENELFYSTLHKAKECNSNLKVIIKNRSECK